MKKKLLWLTIVLLAANAASAAITVQHVITFDDRGIGSLPASYEGLTWEGFETHTSSLYDATSGSTVALVNYPLHPGTVTFTEDVIFDGAYFTKQQGALASGLVHYEGYNDNSLVWVAGSINAGDSAATWYGSGHTDADNLADLVDEVRIYVNNQPVVAFDDFTYHQIIPPVVPAPSAIALVGIGTCLASWLRRRKIT